MKNEQVEINILVEDTVCKDGFKAEHGLSLLIKYRDKEFLFDTGAGNVLCHNAEKMEVDLNKLSGVLLSHGHYDHTGGLKSILKVNPNIPVYAHSQVFVKKYSQRSDKLVENGMELRNDEIVNFVSVNSLQEIEPGMWMTGEIPRLNTYEKVPSRFVNVENGQAVSDRMKDDQALFIETEKGLVIVLGCSHSGVVNIIEHIKNVSDQRIHAIIGGMHLCDADQKQIDWTITYFKSLDFDLLIPLHCTGKIAVEKMIKSLGEWVKIGHTGDVLRF